MGPTPFPSLWLCSPSLHTPPFLNSVWPTPAYFLPSKSNCHLLSLSRPLWASFFLFFFFFNIAPNTCMQKGEVWLVSLHIDADHTGVLFQVGSWPHNGSPRWPREGCSFYKGLSLFLTPIESPFPSSQRRVIRTALHLTYRVAIISTHQGLPPSSLDFKAKRLISCGPWKKGTQFQIQLHIPFEWN